MEPELRIWAEKLIDLALAEDLGSGDLTTDILIPEDLHGKGVIAAKAEGVVAGLEIAEMAFRKVDSSLAFKPLLSDGAKVLPGARIAEIEGRIASILKAERTALNFLQHLSGVATLTARYAEKLRGTRTKLLDTRKTIPGLRILEKYAVRVGGGLNHRRSLGDGILIKDNHIFALKSLGLSLREIVELARRSAPPLLRVEIEVQDPEEALEALEAGADLIMLDNTSPEGAEEVAKKIKGKVLLEASGGISLENAREFAEAGVDFISAGAITHSAPALDLSLELIEIRRTKHMDRGS